MNCVEMTREPGLLCAYAPVTRSSFWFLGWGLLTILDFLSNSGLQELQDLIHAFLFEAEQILG